MKRLFFLLIVLLCVFPEGKACTSLVVSGKATPDGRPLLWKNRDTDFLQNSVKYFKGKKYPFIGIVNSKAKHPTEVWMGTNSAGFAIMNTQSYNLEKDVPNEDDRGPRNGSILFKALEVCATVQDFKNFLDTLARPNGIEANIGVIDAQGGAAMFEVGTARYVFFDANDVATAPHGYIARTNFSFSGAKDEGAGYVRFATEEATLQQLSPSSPITPQWIFSNLSRSFVNAQLGIDLRKYDTSSGSGWFVDQDFIPRRLSASSVVVEGVKAGENPELTTMWTILGYPPVGVAFPLWVKNADTLLPLLLTSKPGETNTPMGKKVDTLKEKVFAFHLGSGSERYIHWSVLFNTQNTGIMQQLQPVEAEIFHRAIPVIEEWRHQKRINTKEMSTLYTNLSDYITERYSALFGL